jgi:hypothetical protein
MKTHWRLVVNYKNAENPEDNPWTEDSWLEETPQECIDRFNATLRPGERARVLITAWELGNNEGKTHTWFKSSPVTIVKKGQVYDEYTCKVCGAKGKRHGLSDFVVPNKKKDADCKGI